MFDDTSANKLDHTVLLTPLPCPVCAELFCLCGSGLNWHAECCHCSKALDECTCHARGEN